jgi:hypothetical protein
VSQNRKLSYKNIDEEGFKLGRQKYRRVGLWGIVVGGLPIVVIIFLASRIIPKYWQDETLIRDTAGAVYESARIGKYYDAKTQAAKAEIKLGSKPNLFTPIRAVGQLYGWLNDLAVKKEVKATELAKVKKDLQEFRTTVNGYTYYRRLVDNGDGLLKVFEAGIEITKLRKKNDLEKAWKISEELMQKAAAMPGDRGAYVFAAMYYTSKVAKATKNKDDNKLLKKIGKQAQKSYYKSPIIKHIGYLTLKL